MTKAQDIYMPFERGIIDTRQAHFRAGLLGGQEVQVYHWAIIYEFDDGSIIRISDDDVELIK